MTAKEHDAKTEQPSPCQPSLRDTIMLEVPFEVKVAPGGGWVAITTRTTNWRDNRYEDICYVHNTATGGMHPLNRDSSAHQVEWVDDNTVALLGEGPSGDKAQVWLYEGLVGEGWALTAHKTGVDWFEPFAGGLLYLARHPKRDENKARQERFGTFTHVEQEESASALYYVGIEEMRHYQAQVKAASEDEGEKLVEPVMELSRLLPEPLSIQAVVPSPTGDAVYVQCQKRDDLVYTRDTCCFRIELDAKEALAEHVRRKLEKGKGEKEGTAGESAANETAKAGEDLTYLGAITPLHLPRGAFVSAVAPDGRKLLVTHRARDERMYTIQDLWIIDLEDVLQSADVEATLAGMHNITAPLDRWVMHRCWVESGIFASYADGTRIRVARFGEDGQVTRLEFDGLFPLQDFHISRSGHIGFVGTNEEQFPEACVAEPSGDGSRWMVKRLTEFGRAAEGWDLPTVETIRWESKDGAEIEGVLLKPADFDPARRYPLVFVVHGGPSWFSSAYLIIGEDLRYYPSIQFVNRDVLVLKPNYRGSMGRGQAFLELNVENLGVGDQWDLEGAIEHLVKLGWVDPERVGCAGWSQGGYISAFVGLHSDKFAVVSVGAGISDWYTYHVSNDIPDFTVDYLSGSPFRGRELYDKTAPISAIAKAKTPMLIQHGSEDRRVPFSNAMELYRGLKEMGVPVELFAFPGMGHPIRRPRENHAVMHQNLAWFSHYLLGEELELE